MIWMIASGNTHWHLWPQNGVKLDDRAHCGKRADSNCSPYGNPDGTSKCQTCVARFFVSSSSGQ